MARDFHNVPLDDFGRGRSSRRVPSRSNLDGSSSPEVAVNYGPDCARYSVDGVCYVEMFGQLIVLKAAPGFLSPKEANACAACLDRAVADTPAGAVSAARAV